MSSEMERQFVEGAARAAYVMAWAEREENPPEGLHVIEWHDRTKEGGPYLTRGWWGDYRCTGAREFLCANGQGRGRLYLFDDEVDSDEPVPPRSFAGQKLEDVAPPTPNYAREWAWKLLGALEEINPQWGRNLPSICAAAARADCVAIDPVFRDEDFRDAQLTYDDVRAFGSAIALDALGAVVSWFDSHAEFELHVPDWSARGFELGDV